MSAQLPIPRNPIKDAEQDFNLLLDQLQTALRERDEAVDLSRCLRAENDVRGKTIEQQQEEIQRKDARILFLQGYATRLTTRLDTIAEGIAAAKREAAQEAASELDRWPRDPSGHPATTDAPTSPSWQKQLDATIGAPSRANGS